MRNTIYTIGISCIGSGVGQSVITSLRLSGLPVKTIGLGTNPMAFGSYECDVFDYTPTIYSEEFVEELIKKCLEHRIDLLIPGRDDEALIYAKNKELFEKVGVKTLVAQKEFIEICRDKERMSNELNLIQNVFVKNYIKQEVSDLVKRQEIEFPLIAKPRGGFASQGIQIILTEEDLKDVADSQIIQEFAMPLSTDPNYNFVINQLKKKQNPQVSEISIQIVLGIDGKLIGKMASVNKLNNGVPIEILPYDHNAIWDTVDKLLPEFKRLGYVGPLNIQGRLTKSGLKIFEMNPRFTGITGLRAIMGFNEVEASVKSWLGIENTQTIQINKNRFGIRQTTDKSVSLEANSEVSNQVKYLNQGDENRKLVAVTGASGFLGQSLIRELKKRDEFRLVAIGRDIEKLKSKFENMSIELVSLDSLFDSNFKIGSIDVFIHAGFARPHSSLKEISESIILSNKLFTLLGMHQIPEIINISSQSVYGQHTMPLWTEEILPVPIIPYAQAKFAVELMLKSINELHPHVKITSLRMAALSGGFSGNQTTDFLSKLVKNAIDSNSITIQGGDQQLEIMDIRDATNAVISILNYSPHKRHEIYNVGSNGIYKLKSVAEIIQKVIKRKNDKSVDLEYLENTSTLNFGMANDLLLETGFNSSHTLEDTIETLVDYFTKN